MQEEVRYFMTQESQDAVFGRVAREYADATKKVATLEAELSKKQRMYQRLSSAWHRVEFIRFDDEPDVPGIPYSGFVPGDLRFSSEEIEGKRLKLLCSDLRAAKAEQADLAEQKKNLGF